MKLIYIFWVLILLSFTTYGQNVGIGTSSPNALLDVSATNGGILIPRVSLTGTGSASPLTSPTISTLVYNTVTVTNVTPGYYYWSGTAWIRLIDNASLGGATTVGNTSSANTLSTTVNGVTGATVPIINSNTLGLSGNTLSSTINGFGPSIQSLSSLSLSGDVTGTLANSSVGRIQGTPVTVSSLANGNLLQYNSTGTDWVNVTPASVLSAATTNALSLSTNTLTSTVNGVAATSSAVSGVSNTSSANTLSTTVNGVTGATVPIVNSISNASSANTLTTTVNGVTGSTVPIINTNTLGLSGTSVTSTVNNVASTALDISSVDKNIYNSDGTLTGNRTLTMGGNTLNFTGGNVGIGSATPAGKMSIITTSSDGNVGAWGTGQLTVGQDGTTAGALGFSYSTTNNAGYISSLSPAIAWRDLGLRANNTIFYYNGSTEGMRLNTSGYVGIAQPNPAGPLDVNGRAGATSFKVNSSFGDLTNNSPWYGIGMSNVTLTGQGSTAVQIGGYFGLTFVESGANRMVINLGNVGIGTTNPTSPLHVMGTSTTPSLSSDAGSIATFNSNTCVEMQFGAISGGSWTSWIQSKCDAQNAAYPLCLQPQGSNVGIGTLSPNGKLDIYNTGNGGDGVVMAPDIDLDNNFSIQTYIDAATGGGGWAGRTTYAGGCCNNLALQPNIGTVSVGGVAGNYGYKFNVIGSAYLSGNIYLGGGSIYSLLRPNFNLALQGDRNMVLYDNGAAVWFTSTGVSDIRTKDHIVPLEDMIPTIMKLSTIRFNYKKELDMGDERHIGVIAQEIVKYFPDMVYYDKKGDRYLLNYDKLTTILIKGMQEQQKEIEDIKASNAILQTENNSIKASVEALRQVIEAKAQK